MLLLLALPAYAHLPHDVVNAIGVPATLDPDRPWLMLGGSEGFQLLLRSDDGGRHWTYWAGPPLQDPLVGVAVLADGTWVLAGEERVWSSVDEGASWVAVAAPGPVGWVAGGEEVVLGTAAGLWTGPAAGPFALIGGRATVDVQPGVFGVAAVDAGGAVWYESGGTWADVEGPPNGATAAAWDGTLYAGDLAGQIWRFDDGAWSACDRLPPEATQVHPEVVRLAGDGATLLAVTGDRGPYASTDRCATWTDTASPLVPIYTGSGSATDTHQAASALAVVGDRILQAGWAGFGVATNGVWDEPVIVPPDYTRGIAFSPNYVRDNTIFVGGYAAGVARSEDGGRSWSAANDGMTTPNVQRIVFPVHSHSSDSVLAISGHRPWYSDDGGESWGALPAPFAYTAELWAWDDGATVWASADPTGGESDATLKQSDDFGETWTVDGALEQVLRGSVPTNLTRFRRPDGTEVRVLGGTDPSVLVVNGDGATWAAVFVDASASRLVGPVPYPENDPVGVVFADSAGVHSSPDGATWSLYTGLGDDQATELAAAESHLFLATESNALWRSDDGGITWRDLGVRLPAAVHTITVGPHFDETPHILFGTHDGVYTLDDPHSDTPALVRFAPYEREDDVSGYVTCVGCFAVDRDADAAMGTLTMLGEAGVMRATIRGETVRVIGTATRRGAADVWVDGELRATIGEDAVGTPDVLASVGGLAFTWHDVEVRAVDEGIGIDAFEATGDGEFFEDAVPAGCGCASSGVASGSAGALMLVGWGLTRRRVGRQRAAPGLQSRDARFPAPAPRL